jgi:formylglycine-generating enzyme
MANAERTPLWKRWWVWCVVVFALGGVLANEAMRLRRGQPAFVWQWPDWFPPAVEIPRPFPKIKANPVPEPALADSALDGQPANTTGDSQVDAYLRDEMRRWQEDFGFDESVLVESIHRSIHAFRPFLLFRGGRDAVREVCRDAHDDADRSRRRLNRGGEFGQAGREETVQRGTYLFNAIEAAAADWLQDKTLENVDPEVPAGGWIRPGGTVLRVTRGNVVNSAGHMIVPGRPDLPATVNARVATALLEWVDEFRLSEEDVPHLSRAVLSRLLVLQPGASGLGPSELARIRACDAGLQWLREARDEARPLFRRTGWVNVPHVARIASESAGQEVEDERESQIVQASAVELNTRKATEKRGLAANLTLAAIGAQVGGLSSDRPAALSAPFDAATAQSARAWWAAGLKLPQELTNSVGAKLVLIPAGEYYMGSTPMEIGQVRRIDPTFKKEWEQEEQPQHRVRITRPFFMGAHEVTRGEFAQFVHATGYQTDAKRDGKGGWGIDAGTGQIKQDPIYDWQNTGFPQTDRDPVVNVSWNDANAFCEWLTRREKAVYRLPTEAEWEYACRAGTPTLFYSGNDPEGLTAIANVADATLKQKFANWSTISGRDGFAFTAPVGSFQPNGFGLFDMHGNVWEWCHDWYATGYYAKSPESDPLGPSRGSVRVFRGGSWYDAPALCRSTFRYWDVPTYRDYFLGFRVVAVPPGR